MKCIRLVLSAAAAGAVLLTGCGQEAALQPAATGGSSPAPDAGGTQSPAASAPGADGTPSGSASPTTATPRSTAPGKGSTRPANALDWGRPAMSGEDLDKGVRFAWAAAHKVAPAQVVGEQLYVGLADSGQLLVGVYQLWVPGGRAYVVVAQGEPRSEAVLVRDSVASRNLGHVDGVVSRTSPHVVVAAAPGTSRVEYRAGAAAAWKVIDQDSLTLVFARAASPQAGEALRITRNGRATVSALWTGPADGGSRPQAAAPGNVLDWPARGTAGSGPSVDAVAAAYAKEMRVPKAYVRRLFSGDTDGGQRFLIGQAWIPGKPARTVGYVEAAGRESVLHIQPETRRGARLVAFLLTEQPGTTTDLLVVVPEPRTTQVDYRPSASAPWRAASTFATLDGVVLVDRAKNPGEDALRLLTGNGDPAAPSTLVVRVSEALCDGPGCS